MKFFAGIWQGLWLQVKSNSHFTEQLSVVASERINLFAQDIYYKKQNKILEVAIEKVCSFCLSSELKSSLLQDDNALVKKDNFPFQKSNIWNV